LLAKRAEAEQNVDVRSWLELTMGDMVYAQFQDSKQAIIHYRKAAASGSSDAAKQARAKLDRMYDENLAELVRNRK